jgi:hypothetical protein
MPSPATNAATTREWRELGFFYDTNISDRAWNLVGSRAGLLKFAHLLRDYAANPRLAPISEHEHYGPYFYLKVVTWHKPLITQEDIRGTQSDIRRLADLLQRGLANADVGQSFDIDADFSPQNEFRLRLHVREDEFDPASADPMLPQSSIKA